MQKVKKWNEIEKLYEEYNVIKHTQKVWEKLSNLISIKYK